MRLKTLIAMLIVGTTAFAQSDPIVMTINGTPVTRSEFEYSYNKNNSEGVIDKKTVDEYVDLFINYKLKVAAALDAHLDTMQSFKNEFAQYRDQQVRPAFVSQEDIEKEAREIYNRTQHIVDSLGGLAKASHILLSVGQKATDYERNQAKLRADSIYYAIKNGSDFAELATKFSDDKGSAKNGGDLMEWIQPGQTVQEFETALFSLNKGEVSKPVMSPYGYHIIKLNDRRNFFPYDSLRTDIITFIDRRGIRDRIIDENIENAAKSSQISKQQLMENKAAELASQDSDLANLIREYHDGLLLYEISNKLVWEKGAKDEEGLKNYFKKNKKRYTWDSPRFKGIAYHVKDKADVKAVKKCVKGVPFDQWADRLRTTFNADSVKRIRVEKALFKVGDNALIDKTVFKKKDVTVTPVKDYPIDATYGKILKKPKEYGDVRGQVVADYQDQLEKEWVAQLRERYPVTVNKEVLSTVNKH